MEMSESDVVLCPDPTFSREKWVWWPLSNFLVVWSQQSWFWTIQRN